MAASELRSRLATLLLMAAAAAALLLYARREDALNRPRPSTGLLYPGLDVPSVTRLYVTLRAGQDLQFERAAGATWRIVEPGPEFARQDYVATILDNLARAQVEPVEQGRDPVRAEDVGLEPPRHVIRFGNDAREQTLLLGEVEPLGRMVYARRLGEQEVVLATRNLVTLLQAHAADFVDPTLLRGLAGPVERILVEEPGGVRLDARRSGERWTLHIPQPVLGDEGRLSTFVRALALARHERVLISRPTSTQLHNQGLPDDADIAAGELHGAMRVALRAPGEPPTVAWLSAGWTGRDDVTVAARRDDSPKVVGVPRVALAMLANDAEFFRERHLLPPIAERAEALRLERAGRTTLAIRRGRDGGWLFEQPERLAGEAVEAERIAGHSVLGDLLMRLDAVEATGFCEPPAGEPVARMLVEWTRAGATTVDRVELHEPTPAGVPCTTSERPGEGLLLDRDVLDFFEPVQADLLRSTRPLDVDGEAWSRLVIERPDGPPWAVRRDEPGGTWVGDDEWSRRVAVGYDMLRGLRGLRWEPARPGADYAWSVRFEDASGTVLGELALRRSAQDEPAEVLGIRVARARIGGRPGVELAVAREWIERLEELSAAPERMRDG